MFSNINATDKNANLGGKLENFKSINFDIATGTEWLDETEKKYFQAEVLVHQHVPLKYITNLDNYDRVEDNTDDDDDDLPF